MDFEQASSLRRRQSMVRHDLARRGVTDGRVLAAMGEVPREEFVPRSDVARAYDDCALQIGEGQTISQPYVVASMLAALELAPEDSILEVGAGSGYVLALAAGLCARVVGLERMPALANRARCRLAGLGYANAALIEADGTLGWPPQAPYAAILVNAAGP